MPIALTRFASRAGDHNDRAIRATPLLAAALSERLRVPPTVIGSPRPASSTTWDRELASALPDLRLMAAHLDRLLIDGLPPVTALSRCAVALATLPLVAQHRPDAVVLWFDAHADLNTPLGTTTGYLGGLALSGPLGHWDSGLGEGLQEGNVILVGTRDVDPAEQTPIDSGRIHLVPVAPDMADDLRRGVAGRPVYVHIDCDVLEPGTVPTDYVVPAGMSLSQLEDCARALTGSEIIGIEVGELETDDADAPDAGHFARRIVEALEPILNGLADPSRTAR
ncbi:arginase [Clavibacter michiganensis]|uniref:arginase family protein n=1 Tax=Clavibacter michiganensis TaxID=28447 RepID=UPI000CE92138|nr:arginase family protein [Clavibacter michiganensis]PPF56439.1 arginase [Clavibacter michiganensis]